MLHSGVWSAGHSRLERGLHQRLHLLLPVQEGAGRTCNTQCVRAVALSHGWDALARSVRSCGSAGGGPEVRAGAGSAGGRGIAGWGRDWGRDWGWGRGRARARAAAMKRDVRILLLGEGRRRAGEPGGGLGAGAGARRPWPMR